MKKAVRFLAATTLAFGSLLFASPSQAEQVMAEITCQAPDGSTRVDMVGWDNTAEFFADKGYIPRLWCEGGYAGVGFVYVSDNLASQSLGYYSGIVPTPTPIPTPTESVTQTVERPDPTPSPTPSPQPEPTPEPPVIQPTPEPTAEPSPEPEPTTEPEPKPSSEPSQPAREETPKPTPTIEPIPEPIPSPEQPVIPEVAPTVQELAQAAEADDPVVPSELAAIPLLGNAAVAILDTFNALGNIGADMTPEVRAKAEKTIVASVIVSNIATTSVMASASAASYRRNK